MSVIINPGSGPVAGANREQAEACIEQFITDLGIAGISSEYVKVCHALKTVGTWPDFEFVEGPPDGRFEFLLRLNDRRCEVEMPGLAVEKVRYLGKKGQNIWDFPRLYIDGSSWVWKYAINCARGSLLGEEEDE